MQEDFVALATELKVERGVAAFVWEACGGDFDAALEMLQSHVHGGTAGVADGGQEDEPPVRAPIRPTERQVLVGRPDMLPWAGPRRAPPPAESFNPFSRHGRAPGDERKAELLERMYRPPLEICFRGDFESAVKKAEERRLPLLVNVQDESEFACQLLNRDTWQHEGLKRFVAAHFVFWQPAAASPEGRFYLQFYPVALYPHIAVVDSASRFRELVLEGPIAPEQLQRRLEDYLAAHSPAAAAPAPAADSDRTSLMDLSEQQQLERAIQESLQEQEEEQQGKEREMKKEKEEEEEERLSPPKRRKTDAEAEEEEPAASGRPPDTTVRVRDGAGRTRTIRVHSEDTLARLAWVVAREFGLGRGEGFELSTVMPRVFVTALPPESRVGVHGLGGSTLVLEPKKS